ncbi:PGPGW domain-containing protein [Angustibacter luteus]|uniref:PGPGW domain-containing protein n=1 Tax=Angustibacter luteus TaxID=658456 RepID=A0ABW1JCJ4_9ACTN
MQELVEYLIDLDGLDNDQQDAIGRAVLGAMAPVAARFQIDIPGARPGDPEDMLNAGEVLRVAAGKTSEKDRAYATSGWLDATDPALWEAMVTFMPWSYDGDVWNGDGRQIVGLHDGEVTYVALNDEQLSVLSEIVGPGRLLPWAQVRSERRAARRAWLRRNPVLVGGWLAIIVGILLVPLPGPGLPVMLAGLAVVAGASITSKARRRRASTADRHLPPGDCSGCGHPWSEHRGSGNDRRGMCGECAYEFEHDQRATEAPGCRLSIPAAR